ncbi:MAG: hypothetical protein ACRD16_15755 [Thermoanaerobaculia bacterium]
MGRQYFLKTAAFFLILTFSIQLSAQSEQNPAPIPEAVGPAVVEAPQPMGSENDVYCFGFVGEPVEHFDGMIVSGDAVYEQSSFMYQDIVYTENYGELRAGDEYWLVSPMDEVIDLTNGRSMGRFYQYLGRAKALCVKDKSAILEITFACTEIPIGSFVKPFDPIPVPLARRTKMLTNCDDPSGKRVGAIIYSRDSVEGLFTGADVIINMGADAGLNPGDFLTVFRFAVPREFDIASNGDLRPYRANIEPPRTILGEAAVLTVGDHTATVQIVSGSHAMQLGDNVEIK